MCTLCNRSGHIQIHCYGNPLSQNLNLEEFQTIMHLKNQGEACLGSGLINTCIKNLNTTNNLIIGNGNIQDKNVKILIYCAATTSCINSKFRKLGEFTPSNFEVNSFNAVKTCIEVYINAKVNFCKFSLKAN